MNNLTGKLTTNVEHDMNRCGVGWFKFDEPSGNVTDSKGNAVGTINGGITRVAGWNGTGNALSFNGANGYVQFNQKIVPLGKKSIRFKIKKLASTLRADNYWEFIMSNELSSPRNGLAIYIIPTTGQIGITYHNIAGASIAYIPSIYNICDGLWHDIAIIQDQNNITMYVDDFLNGNVTIQSESIGNTNLHLGTMNASSTSTFFNGFLDNLEVYNDVIDPHFNKFLISSAEKFYSYSDFSTNINRYGVGWFKFNEPSGNVTDSIGNAVGTITGDVKRVAGWNGTGNALSFNGTNGYVQFSQPIIPDGKRSIRFKFKVTSVNALAELVASSGGTANKGDRFYVSENGYLSWQNSKGTTGEPRFLISFLDKRVNDGQWHDVLATWDATLAANSAKLYLDGVLKSATPSTLADNEQTRNLTLGRNASSAIQWFNGQIDELEIYNDVITLTTKIIVLTKNTVDNFINYGLENGDELDLSSEINEVQYIEDSSSTLGTGKVFKQVIDTSKTAIKKAIIE